MTSLARLAPAAAAAILLTAGIVTLALLTTHDDESLFVHLQGVPDQDLLNSGVSLTAPQGPAKIDLRTAVSAANSPGASGGVKETVLVHLKEANSVPPVDQASGW